MSTRFETREFNGSSFMESFDVETGVDLRDFDDYAYRQSGLAGVEDEQARPYRGIVAGRCWETDDGRQFSAFAYTDPK